MNRFKVSASATALAIGLSLSPAMAQTVTPPQIDIPAEARANPANWPRSRTPSAITDAAAERFIDQLMARMTLEEKVGQTIQGDFGEMTPQDLIDYPLGSILGGGNSEPGGDPYATPQQWLDVARAFREAALTRGGAAIPILFGLDAVHGHNNVVGATLFPHNIGLGATRNPELVGRIAEATAIEVAVTGVDWTFGPTLAVPRDDRWGRSYEGYGEDPEIVAAYAGPVTLGLQGRLEAGRPLARGRIAGSAKHFLADGGTLNGKDQGDARISEEELATIHAAGYPPAIDAGVLTVMASFSGWNGVKHSGNPTLLTDVLRGPLGFEGFVVSDWNAHAQLPGCSNESCPLAFNAGIDMFMAPDTWKPLFHSMVAQVRSGEISQARLDEAVRRILRVKVKLGLFETTQPNRELEGRFELLGAPEHRALARQAVRESLVLLKNNDGVLPIRGGARVLVAGVAADDIGQASGGWTLTWQGVGNTNAHFPNAQSILSGVREAVSAAGGEVRYDAEGEFEQKPDVAIVVFGETPYAEFQGDLDHLDFVPTGPLETLRRLKAAGIPTVSVFLSGRPMWTNPEINASDAFVAAWLPGSEGGGIADVLIGDAEGRPRHDFKGRLSFSWPRTAIQTPLNRGEPGYDPQFAYGHGLTYAAPDVVPVLAEDSGVTAGESAALDLLVDGRFPSPWSLYLTDEGGDYRTGLQQTASSPQGRVSMRPVDAGAQESGRALNFSGGGAQTVVIATSGAPIDLSTATMRGRALTFRYRVDQAPQGVVSLGLGQARRDVTSILAAAPAGQWREMVAPLSCFAAAGATLDRISTPFVLGVEGALGLSIADIRLTVHDELTCGL